MHPPPAKNSPLLGPLLLNRNESHFEPVAELKALFDTWDWSGSLRFYAKREELRALEKGLLAHLGVSDIAQVCLFHGAEDALLKVFLWKNASCRHLILPDFSWNQYLNLAAGLGFSLKEFAVRQQADAHSFDLAHLRQVLSELQEPGVVLLPCPNNPTGHTLDPALAAHLVGEFPQHTFVLDGVYEPFPSRYCVPLAKHDNAIFISSLSKFFGLPGLRFGFAVGRFPRALQMDLGPQRLAVATARTVLECVPKFSEQWDFMNLQSNSLREAVRAKIPAATAFQSCTNFLLLEVGKETNSALLAAKRLNMEPKSFQRSTNSGTKSYIRWSLGPPDVMRMLEEWVDLWAQIIGSGEAEAPSLGPDLLA